MPRDTGLPQRLDRAMLIESAARQIEAHRSGQVEVVRNQPAFQGQRNWRRGLNQDPFRCSYCRGNNTLRSFATLYAQGSSLSKYRKGWPCPNCGKPLMQKAWFHNDFSSKCLHCGLSLKT